MICIDVTDFGARVVLVKGKSDDVKLSDCAKFGCETRLISGGKVNEDALVELLKPALDKKSGKAAITFSTLQVTSNDYLLPPLKGKRAVHNAVLSKVFAGLSSEEYLVGYRTSDDEEKGLVAQTYVMPRSVVEAAFRVLTRLNLKPAVFAPPQDCVEAAAECFSLGEHIIVANVDKSSLVLHLINRSEDTMTRLSGAVFGVDRAVDVADKLSKLLQYQQIKYPETPAEKIYILGEEANNEFISAVGAELDIPVCGLTLAGASGEYIYAVGAAL